jgi:cytochrome c-type biogenesis protein
MSTLHFLKDRSSRDKTGSYPAFFIALIVALLLAQPVSGLVIVEYFHQPGCINCEMTDPLIDTIRTQYRDRVAVEDIVIDDRAGVRLLLSYGVTEIPVVVINRNKVLSFRERTAERLDTEIRLAESGAYPVPGNRKSLFDGDNFPSVFFSFCLGLMTGLSPCLLGGLVVLIAASGSPAAAGKTGKYYPLIFGAGIITAYLIVAAVILGAGIALRPDPGSRLAVYGIGGLIAIAVGIIQVGLVSLPDRMSSRVSGLVSRFHTLPGIFLLGIIFAALFAPCAIAPFLVLIEAILIGNAIAPAVMILAFSAGLFTPFVVLTILRNSVAEKKMLGYAGIVQKIGGGLLIVFGLWLILSI